MKEQIQYARVCDCGSGKVENRIEGNVNPKLPTGEIEIIVHRTQYFE